MNRTSWLKYNAEKKSYEVKTCVFSSLWDLKKFASPGPIDRSWSSPYTQLFYFAPKFVPLSRLGPASELSFCSEIPGYWNPKIFRLMMILNFSLKTKKTQKSKKLKKSIFPTNQKRKRGHLRRQKMNLQNLSLQYPWRLKTKKKKQNLTKLKNQWKFNSYQLLVKLSIFQLLAI